MFFFTADEHYGHSNIIRFCGRPFASVDEMDAALIANHNSVVKPGDITVHVGDFTLASQEFAQDIIKQLRGQHIFLYGSHDYWLKDRNPVWTHTIEGQYVVACHYAFRVWAKSHYGSWQVYGHSHGRLPPQGKQWDVGVDNNGFFPVSWEQLKLIMFKQPDNFNLVKNTRGDAPEA
jgi:calcineurin-like phosphoesterase family protein